MKITEKQKQMEYITDNTCKYGHMMGWSNKNNCYKCSDCGFLDKLKENEHKPLLITELD